MMTIAQQHGEITRIFNEAREAVRKDLFSRYRHNDKWDCHGDEAPVAAEAVL